MQFNSIYIGDRDIWLSEIKPLLRKNVDDISSNLFYSQNQIAAETPTT